MTSEQSAAPPRHAATVILLRQAANDIEALVILRHQKLAFMGGQWVFPGGALAAADASDEALSCIPEDSRARCSRFADLHGAQLPQSQCLGLAVAAYRETFEETGLLIARDRTGSHCSDDLLYRAREQRSFIASSADRFAAFLLANSLVLDVDRLVYWAHWITPSNAPRRFDTRFFLIQAPHAQAAAIDLQEAVDHAWMSPAAIVRAALANEMPVSHPTLYNLMELDALLHECGSLEAALARASVREIPPILPKVIRDAATTIVLPWDAEYRSLPGAEAPLDVRYPATLRALPSRMTSRN